MLLASFVTRVYEESGDFSIDANRASYSPYRRYAGIKSPQQDGEPLKTGTEYKYEVASVDYLGQAVANTELEVRVYKVHWYWWWSSDNGNLVNYVSNSYNKPVKPSPSVSHEWHGLFQPEICRCRLGNLFYLGERQREQTLYRCDELFRLALQ